MVQKGKRVGILDADIFGPSIPRLLSLSGEPRTNEGESSRDHGVTAESRLLPLTNYGLKAISMGFLVPAENAIVWRGLMVMKALQQLLHEVEWGGLDVLVIDMPPGTGDTQLTITQQIFLDGTFPRHSYSIQALLLFQPPKILRLSTLSGGSTCSVRLMFRYTTHSVYEINGEILGIIENMASFTCPHCHHSTPIFLSGGVEREAKKHNIQILGSVPLNEGICADSDQGRPTVISESGSSRGQVFRDIADKVLAGLDSL